MRSDDLTGYLLHISYAAVGTVDTLRIGAVVEPGNQSLFEPQVRPEPGGPPPPPRESTVLILVDPDPRNASLQFYVEALSAGEITGTGTAVATGVANRIVPLDVLITKGSPSPVCDDGFCSSDEDCVVCGEDCDCTCGDGICVDPETCTTCSQDCEPCPGTDPFVPPDDPPSDRCDGVTCGDNAVCLDGQCQCSTGVDCGPQGQCILDETSSAQCRCNDGYEADGLQCAAVHGTTCSQDTDCSSGLECIELERDSRVCVKPGCLCQERNQLDAPPLDDANCGDLLPILQNGNDGFCELCDCDTLGDGNCNSKKGPCTNPNHFCQEGKGRSATCQARRSHGESCDSDDACEVGLYCEDLRGSEDYDTICVKPGCLCADRDGTRRGDYLDKDVGECSNEDALFINRADDRDFCEFCWCDQEGDGDCDGDDECRDGLVCIHDVDGETDLCLRW